MSHYKPYPAYKDSGVEWLGAVPVDWAVVPLKFLAVIKNGKDHKDVETADGEFPVMGSGGEFARASRCMFDGESVLLGRKGTIDRPLYVDGPFWSVDTMFYTEIGPKTSAKYFFYCTLTIQFNRYSTNTALPSMTQEVLGQIPFAIPPHATQCAIVDHLDRETARIDGLISRKTRFIELLREKRQALITHAVTKGLNPKVQMKDSGVEWLGDVPTHWSAKCVKYVARLESGHTPSMKIAEYWVDCDIPWVSLGDSSQLKEVDYIHDTAKYLNKKGLQGSSAHILPIGTVIFTRDATVGLAAITGREMAVSQHLIGWVPGDTIRSEYLLRVFNVMESWLSTLTVGATIKTIGMDDIRTLMTPVPPIEEQDRIVEYVLTWMTKFDGLISTTKSSIELLKERRSALITAAVTGQIDLRETV